MSRISFIHLSDIHFVKSSNNPADIDKALREAILTDLKMNAKQNLSSVSGILVTGDFACTSNELEYNIAKDYRAEICEICEICEIFDIKTSDVYCVPGNHDINRITISDSHLISLAQSSVDEKATIDDADKAFEVYSGDKNLNALFKPFAEYNEFAKRFECAISTEKLYWEKN